MLIVFLVLFIFLLAIFSLIGLILFFGLFQGRVVDIAQSGGCIRIVHQRFEEIVAKNIRRQEIIGKEFFVVVDFLGSFGVVLGFQTVDSAGGVGLFVLGPVGRGLLFPFLLPLGRFLRPQNGQSAQSFLIEVQLVAAVGRLGVVSGLLQHRRMIDHAVVMRVLLLLFLRRRGVQTLSAEEGFLNVFRILSENFVLFGSPSLPLFASVRIRRIIFGLLVGVSTFGLEAADADFPEISVTPFPQHQVAVVLGHDGEPVGRFRGPAVGHGTHQIAVFVRQLHQRSSGSRRRHQFVVLVQSVGVVLHRRIGASLTTGSAAPAAAAPAARDHRVNGLKDASIGFALIRESRAAFPFPARVSLLLDGLRLERVHSPLGQHHAVDHETGVGVVTARAVAVVAAAAAAAAASEEVWTVGRTVERSGGEGQMGRQHVVGSAHLTGVTLDGALFGVFLALDGVAFAVAPALARRALNDQLVLLVALLANQADGQRVARPAQ